ncbi:M48 family metalloprotease, partial [Candidatus Bathyarchaeota archaeon]|nr:M48 family metalloprotease [Candidatus Bathyarchaeota archaeon]
MAGTVALIVAVSTLGFSMIMSFMGVFNLYTLAAVVVIFNIAQWLLAPYIINRLYGVRPFEAGESPELHRMIGELSERSGITTPRLMFSKIPIPNAFAYGSPLTGNHVAVTQGLLSSLEAEEVEAVIGHELGHIKHRDVQVMMFISLLPSLFYMVARSTMFSRYSGRDRRDTGGLAALGSISM